MTTLTEVGAQAMRRPYPTDLLRGCRTALILFGAAFLGGNDGWYIAHAGIVGTVVDTDEKRLEAMAELYPTDWEFVNGDAFAYADRAGLDSFDLVSVDCFTNLSPRCVHELKLWTRIAKRVVVVTATDEALDLGVVAPVGWSFAEVQKRTPGVHWLVLTKN